MNEENNNFNQMPFEEQTNETNETPFVNQNNSSVIDSTIPVQESIPPIQEPISPVIKEEPINPNPKKGNSLILVIVLLLVLLIGAVGYIVYGIVNPKDKCKEEVDPNVQVEPVPESKYISYVAEIPNAENVLVLYYPTDEKDTGFFSLTEATDKSFITLAGGYFVIKDTSIEFYNNLDTELLKTNFAKAFGLEATDLYQDEESVTEGNTTEYRVKLVIEEDKIYNDNISFDKVIV